ncbi:hypothetical protein ACH5RR_019484 [Cinchona calisaya]|uniref:Protein kinase domain-containing protein n=1 Tax=Cinchona calisaya TaxID=153742 RepID=A0ABD2ZSK5_9GENT
MDDQMKLQFIFAALLFLFLQLSTLPQIIADLNSDRQALLDFAKAVPRLRKLNWNSGAHICSSWAGINCNKDGTRVTAIHLPGVGLYGPIPENTIGKLGALRILSLRSNFLNGSIPSDVLSIPSLQSLYLHHNNFSGKLPLSFSPQLGAIDLSFNSFSEAIPNLNLPRLKMLNLSYNLLSGSIPSSLQKFPMSSFVGNSHLCGAPLTYCSAVSPSPSPLPDYLSSSPVIPGKQNVPYSKKLNGGAIVAIVIGGSSILLLIGLMFLFFCLKKKDRGSSVVMKGKVSNGGKSAKPEDFGSGVQEAEKNKLVFFDGCSYNFDLEDLLRASAEVLGKGTYGTAYKAVLDEGTMVVVKRLREVGIGKKEFEQHMEVLRSVGQHANIVPLRAYYYSKDEKLLVHEYMPAGSLSAALHGNRGAGRTPLDWDSRMKISTGAARGIAHIHSEGGLRFSHGNIKSSNVLLNKELDGCVTDFGLNPVMNFLGVKTRGIGYHAPEVIETRKVTQKSDVYSFGVLLLEILTGKSPILSSGLDDVIDLPRWVRSVVREEWTAEVFDVELMKYQNVEEEMVQMLQIALSCVAKAPDSRPSMDEVVRMMEDIKQSEMENRPSSEDNRSKGSNMNTP